VEGDFHVCGYKRWQAVRVVILGTGTSQGIPVIGCHCPVCKSDDPKDSRLRVSAYIEVNGVKLLIDIGPDFRRQMLENDLEEVDAVLITHEHNDHTAGVDDIRPINFRYKNEMPFYALPRVAEQLELRFAYAFGSNKYPGAPVIQLNEVELVKFEVQGVEVIPIKVMHGKLDILAYRIGGFAYLTDVKTIPEEEYRKLQGVDVLVINALRKEPHYTHLNLDEALEVADKIGARQTYLTHVSHKFGTHREIEALLPLGINVAYDGMEIILP
jgi:phosphoribosyl 1,2-cyclic phosphate phosphodiesterase